MKVSTKIAIFLFSVLLISGNAIAQGNAKNYHLSVRSEGAIPSSISNKAFKGTFVGVYDFSGALCFNYYKGLYIGGLYKNALFKVPLNKIPGLKTLMHINYYGGKIGYDYHITDMATLTFGVNIGEADISFSSVVPLKKVVTNKSYTYTSYFIEPEVILNLFTEENFAVGIKVSYTILQKAFDPDFAHFNDYKTYLISEKGGFTSSFNFGFGFYFGFLKKKNAVPINTPTEVNRNEQEDN